MNNPYEIKNKQIYAIKCKWGKEGEPFANSVFISNMLLNDGHYISNRNLTHYYY